MTSRWGKYLLSGIMIAVLAGCQTSQKDANSSPGDGTLSETAAPAQDMGIDDPEKSTVDGLKRSLFERAGGKPTIDAVASDFVDMLAQHPVIMENSQAAAGLGRDPTRHKQMLSDYLCRVSGGGCTYSGKNLKEAHAGLAVTGEQWKVMGALFVKAMRKNNVPKAERGELATLVAANRPLIVKD